MQMFSLEASENDTPATLWFKSNKSAKWKISSNKIYLVARDGIWWKKENCVDKMMSDKYEDSRKWPELNLFKVSVVRAIRQRHMASS